MSQNNDSDKNVAISVKKSIKTLHFSDGELEIFEDDDKDDLSESTKKDQQKMVNEVFGLIKQHENLTHSIFSAERNELDSLVHL